MSTTDTNLGSLYYARETAWGETPNGTKTLKELNITGESLDVVKEAAPSEAIHSHRGVGQMVKTGLAARGGINTEFAMADYNDWLESLLATTWVTATETVTGTVAGQVITISGTFSAAIQKSRYIKIALAATSGNNGIKKVVSWTTNTVTLAAGSLSGSDASDVMEMTYNYLINGNVVTSYLVERKYGNLDTPHFIYWTGMMIDSAAFSMGSKAKVGVNWNFIGESPVSSASTGGSGSPTAKPTSVILTTNANVGTIYENGSAIVVDVSSLNQTISNGLRERPALGYDATLKPGLGNFEASGTLEAYFSDKALLDRFLNHSDSILEYSMSTSAPTLLNFYMPKIKLTTGNAPITGRSADIMQSLGFYALPDSTGRIIQVDYLS